MSDRSIDEAAVEPGIRRLAAVVAEVGGDG
jgi:hypothetical protein